MSQDLPVIFDRKPVGVDVEEGQDYYWCSCGMSTSQPFCDGSHLGSPLDPVMFVAKKTGKAYLCLCKHTKNPPYCDGYHNKLPKDS